MSRIHCQAARYSDWRQDGVSDLLLITLISSTLLIMAALFKRTIIDPQHEAAVAAAALAATGVSETVDAVSAVSSSAAVTSSGAVGLPPWLDALTTDMYQVLVLAFGENLPNPYEAGEREDKNDTASYQHSETACQPDDT